MATPSLYPCRRLGDSFSQSRRQWLQNMGYGMGGAALVSLIGGSQAAALPVLPHIAPKAKRVICLFMSGGFSQLESFDHKPLLTERHGEQLPPSVFKGRKPLGMSKFQSNFRLQASTFPFQQHGRSGAWVSDRFPHIASKVDRICFLKGIESEAVNHDPAIIFMNSGHQLPGRPVMGSWMSYGLGSENENLPAYIVLVTKKPADQPLSTRLWDSGFLPSQHQGVPFRPGKDPVLFLNNPPGISPQLHRRMLDSLAEVQQDELARRGESEIEARIQQYEMAFRMQTSVPDVVDIAHEPSYLLDRYGPDVRTPGSYAHHCLLARRLCESGVRFVQLFHPGWDHHEVLQPNYTESAKQVDQPTAALLADLEERGLMEDTLVMFVTEFGRTCYSQGAAAKPADKYGREHHRNAFTVWLAGAGVKPGMTHGETDEFGFDVASGKTTVNDFHATLLHLLGIQHEQFTYRFQGRDYRLTDVAGEVIKPILTHA
jgi:Protein of unknown function (DUF1501)